jgi:glucosylceramidase
MSVHRSSLYGAERLAAGPALAFVSTPLPDTDLIVTLDAGVRFQEIIGFGAAFTEAAAHVFYGLDPSEQTKVLRAYFDPVHGHGYTFCRTHINSCDFSLGSWTYVEQPGDLELKTFSLDHDRCQIIPLVKAAKAIAAPEFKLFSSPWSPPAWMKTNGTMLRGGKLKPECRASWAEYYCRYIEGMAAEGLPIWALTVQNEPAATQTWESCVYTAEEERDFVRDHLGPTLHKRGHADVKVICWDHNRDLLLERAQVMFSDPKASAFVWGIGFHWYVTDAFNNVRSVKEAYPDKHLIFTEGCQEGGAHIGSWVIAERYLKSLFADLNHGVEAWVDWNLMLDAKGGPNHVGNLCSAPIMATPDGTSVVFNPSYAALGHFSRFIRPGARRILCGSPRDEVLTTAFRNVDGTLALVVANTSERDFPLVVRLGTQHATLDLPRRSVATALLPAPL